MSTQHLHPIVRAWFERRFTAPTEAQAQGWPAIAQGRHTLIAAPTGSGKTLAAFLTALDALVRQALDGGLLETTQVVYVSPLKALANDIQTSLLDPLEGILAEAEAQGTPLPEIRVAVRTGDTPMSERAKHVRNAPHILITTPESLYILLTAERSRRALAGVRTLILDELHALAPNKRGAHLALSVERLCALAERPVTRIGLSATQKPIETVAAFLTGQASDYPPPTPPSTSRPAGAPFGSDLLTAGSVAPAGCVIVDTGHRRAMDIAVELPEGFELGPIASHELWAQVLDQVAEHVRAHRTSLVFVNTRRLVERVAHLLSERLGEENVVAHHGSLSKERRFEAEQRLKAGTVQVCVATASLELGIDVGDVELVCQVGSPRNIGVALQRVGRSGHWLGGTPTGRFFPLTRDELVETVALVRAMNAGMLDALSVPPWPLDVLAQQIVAACAVEEWDEDALFALVRRAHPYRALERERFDETVAMLSDGIAGRWGRSSAYLHRDGVHRRIRGRRGARLAAVTSGGAIPDTADYMVVAEPEGTMVGTVNEDFAIESNAGDVFLLGNTPWRIRRVEAGVLRVDAAQGQSPTIPFWLGEAPGRTPELSAEVSAVRSGVAERLPLHADAVELLVGPGVGADAAEQVVSYIEEGVRVLGVVPTAEKLVAERFFDEGGGMQLVIHSPYGARINRAWGLALRKRFCVGFNFELQAAATDDGINIALGPMHSFAVEEVFRYVKSPTAEATLLQAVLQSPLFPLRWRWTASRSLALLRHAGGKKVPAPIQRMRSDDLLAAVFPDAAACQDNMPAGVNITPPDHPLVFETVRDCLTEALDTEGMLGLLRRIETGQVEVLGVDTVQPSAFSHQLLNAMPYAFLDDAPLEERRARAVTLRRALPEDARELGALDASAIAAETAKAWPLVRDAHELHDALLSLGVMGPVEASSHEVKPEKWQDWFTELQQDGRAFALEREGRTLWYAAERAGLVGAAYGLSTPLPSGASSFVGEPEEAQTELARGRSASAGPFTAGEMAALLALPEGAITRACLRLEAEGLLLRGAFRKAPDGAPLGRAVDRGVGGGKSNVEFCDRRVLARIHRATVGRLRREIEPVQVAGFIRFLLCWQHVHPGARLSGESGLAEAVEQLQGFEAAASAWEASLLPARVQGYQPGMLDALCFAGELAWGRFAGREGVPGAGLNRNGPVTLGLREELGWLLDPPGDERALTGAAADVLEHLRAHGASFLPDIAEAARRLPSEVEDGLWTLVAAGLVTADGFAALRGLVSGAGRRAARRGSRFT
ncbi:MAG: DEAD/DEAH box helicase, partial [Chloroflexota bacterium]